ncbi:hypothetical protein DFS34DRAFT_667092 [Phlyctochytrium arcticum]|nr:hypothetical protein DFS34DRAFT_667092 [Phlyctochytrium arcticum]
MTRRKPIELSETLQNKRTRKPSPEAGRIVYAPPKDPPPDLDHIKRPNDTIYAPPPCPPPPSSIDYAHVWRVRALTLGVCAHLSDDFISERVLPFCDASDLNKLAAVSKGFYQFARDDQLWRRLCLSKWGKASIDNGGLCFKGTWRLTYYFPGSVQESEQSTFMRAQLSMSQLISGLPDSPYMRAKWSRCHMSLTDFKPTNYGGNEFETTIARIEGNIMTSETFQEEYESLSRPVMILGLAKRWMAMQTWSIDAYKEKHGSTLFKVGNEYGHPQTVKMAFGAYIDYMSTQHDESPLYVFDDKFAQKAPELAMEYAVPDIFSEDYFSVLGEERPPYKWLVVGPARSGASWHVDPMGTSAWNTLISGHKRWALYPPHCSPPGLREDDEVPPSTLLWYLEVYPHLPNHLKPIEILQEPGETIFVPAGWWHAVLNLDTFNIAITHNWCGRWNLPSVVEELVSSEKASHKLLLSRLQQNLVREKPNLNNVFQKFGTTRDPYVLAEGYAARNAMCEGYVSDSDKWLPRLADVLARKGICTSLSEDAVEPLSMGGDNPIFLHTDSDLVVKFYSHFGHGLASYVAESTALAAIAGLDASNPIRMICPSLADRGLLYPPNSDKWSWPYSIQNFVGGPLTQAVGEVSDRFSGQDWRVLTEWLGDCLKGIHTCGISQNPSLDSGLAEPERTLSAFISRRLESAVADHQRWGHLPPHLLRDLPSYLREGSALLTSTRMFLRRCGIRPASISHGDLSGGNILGKLSYSTDDEALGPPDICKTPTWTPTHLIDFGDAFISTNPEAECMDPFWDLAILYSTTLKCKPELLRTLLGVYCGGDGWTCMQREIQRRLCLYTILWDYEAGVKGMKRHVALSKLESWKQVEEVVFAL